MINFYTELAISSLTVAITIASTHFAYPQRGGQAELAWVAWLNTKTVYPTKVIHLSTDPAGRRVTSLMRPMTLRLSQTTTVIVGIWLIQQLDTVVVFLLSSMNANDIIAAVSLTLCKCEILVLHSLGISQVVWCKLLKYKTLIKGLYWCKK